MTEDETMTTTGAETERPFPWNLVEDLDRRGSFVIRTRMYKLLEAADTARHPSYSADCWECAMRCWDELVARGAGYIEKETWGARKRGGGVNLEGLTDAW